ALRLAEQRVSFVNRVSHELRTPMTNILLNSDLLSDSLPPENERAKKRLEMISEEANRLGRLIENVLTFSQSEREYTESEGTNQNLRVRPCEVGPVIEEALSHFSQSLSRNGVEPKLNLPDDKLFVLADRDGLLQIFSNLISNVAKYATEGSALEIKARCSSDGRTISVTTSDDGPGIPSKEASRIFDPFERLHDSTTEGVSGTGLGLAIARDLAESMGGISCPRL
ncbi:MAG: HAMP domain-containing sensor histidine kinase, partial [Verrucomicrobiota bacterium]